MKKLFLTVCSVFLLFSLVFSQSISVHQGWNFFGAQENQITMNQFAKPGILGLMKYVGNGSDFYTINPQDWAVWSDNETIMNWLIQAGFQKLYTLYQGDSFIVYSTSNNILNLNIKGYCPANFIPIATESYNYQTGGYAVISLKDFKAYKNLNSVPLGGDIRSYFFDGYIFMVDAPNTGNIATFYVYKVGSDDFNEEAGTNIIANYNINRQNPHSIAFKSLEKAYLTTYYDNNILIFNPLTGVELGTIDLTPYLYVSDNGTKNKYIGAEHMLIYKNKLFVSIDRARTYYGDIKPDKSMIIVIDTDTDQIVNTVEVPYEPRSLQVYNGFLYFLAMGDWNNPIGIIYRINLSTMKLDENFKISPIFNNNSTEYIKNFQITPDGEVYLICNSSFGNPYNVYKILNINVYDDNKKTGLVTTPIYFASSYIPDVSYVCGYIVIADRGKADIDYKTKEIKQIITPGAIVLIDKSGKITKISDTDLGYPPYKIGTDYNY